MFPIKAWDLGWWQEKNAIVLHSLNIYFLPPSCQGLFRVFSGWVPLVNKFRIPIISETCVALTSDLLSQTALGQGSRPRMGRMGEAMPASRSTTSAVFSQERLSSSGRKRAWSHQPTLKQKSPEKLPSRPPGFCCFL